MKSGLRDVIAGPRCRLVPLSSRHTDDVVSWRNDPANARWFSAVHHFTRDGHEAWLARADESGTDFNWAIETVDGAPVGTIALYNVDWEGKRAEYGRVLVGEAAARGKGFGRAATSLVFEAAYRTGLDELYLVVKDDNAAAIRLYVSLGFERTGSSGGMLHMATRLREKSVSGAIGCS